MAKWQRLFKTKNIQYQQILSCLYCYNYPPHPRPSVQSSMYTNSLCTFCSYCCLVKTRERGPNSKLVKHKAKRRENPQKGKREPHRSRSDHENVTAPNQRTKDRELEQTSGLHPFMSTAVKMQCRFIMEHSLCKRHHSCYARGQEGTGEEDKVPPFTRQSQFVYM